MHNLPDLSRGEFWSKPTLSSPGVTVDLTLPDSTVKSILTDGQGGYRFDQIPAGRAGNRIPGSLDRVISAGVAINPPEGGRGLMGSLRLRHFGPRPLIEDASVKSKTTSLVNGEFGYRLNNSFQLVGEVYNLFNQEASDIDYFYTSRLPGEPPEGVDDIHTHPALPRTFSVSLRVGL
jgi:outer membrane receptor protein involved in Fe transport